MDAIPSLCATTASCGAAAIGHVYARSASHAAEELQETLNGARYRSTTIATGHPPGAAPDLVTPSRPHHRRPQSASVLHSAPLWSPTEDGPSILNENSGDSIQPAASASAWSPVGELVGDKGITRTTWTRRMSTIAQSQDGSSLSSQRPSSPSLFSNGSNAPFFPSNQVVTPRNRLVKRSTSHRVLHSASYSSSPLSPSQTPTFRRPATSHQRFEQQQRLQILQRELEEHPSPPPRLDLVDIPPAELDSSKAQESPARDWHLYFETSIVHVPRDTPLRSASLARGTRNFDAIRRVRPGSSFFPKLVKPSMVTKPSVPTNFVSPLGAPRSSYDPEQFSNSPSRPDNAQAKGLKARHSLSLSDAMSTPTPSTWKIRRGSVKKAMLADGPSGRRVASAPQRSLLETTQDLKQDSVSLEVNEEPSQRAENGGRSQPSAMKQPSRTTSSPLPPLQRLSAFEIDLPNVSRPGSPSQDDHQADSSILPPSPGSPNNTPGQSSLRIKPHRTSRIPSDRASTVFSSDNEHSRVFSADGDDYDCRSETVYDSIRTEATGSSHSGAKGITAETVFQRPTSSEFTPRSLQTLQDKLTSFNMSEPTTEDVSAPEGDLSRVASSSAPASVDPTSYTSQRVFPLSSVGGSVNTVSTRTRQGSSVAPQKDEFWSIEEEDSNWGDTDATALGDTSTPVRDARESLVEQSRPTPESAVSNPDTQVREALQHYVERGGRTAGRRTPLSLHLRSQSVPLQPENSKNRFNKVSKLDAWMLGGKGVSEDWDGDFEFDDPEDSPQRPATQSGEKALDQDQGGVLVPPSILERQASVHGQFGQVKELSQLVEELRVLHNKAHALGILHGQSAELWKEAEGIIDLATLDEDEVPHPQPQSPHSSSFDFEAFDDEASLSNRTVREPTPIPEDGSLTRGGHTSSDATSSSQQLGTPTRPRQESIAKAKHVLEHIIQQRSSQDPLPSLTATSPRKLPFDTTSLRDLVTRAGVVKRALAEIVRRVENPDRGTPTPERRARTPTDPPFSQIFQNSPTPSSSRKSPRIHREKSSNSFLKDSPSPTDSDRNGHIQIMSVG